MQWSWRDPNLRGLTHVRTDDVELQRRGSTVIGDMLIAAVCLLVAAILFYPLESTHISSIVLVLSAVLTGVLIPVCRSGRVNLAVYAFGGVLWFVAVGQPMVNQDMSTNPIFIPVGAIVLVTTLPRDRLWWAGVWAVTALVVLWLATTAAATVQISREIWVVNAAVVAIGGVAVVVHSSQRLAEAWARQHALLAELQRHRRMVQELDRAANTDPLTGLANRRALSALMDSVVISADGSAPAVAIVDLDRFKSINDRYSHATGDAVLQRFGELLSAGSRSSDLVFRFGGDEFVVVSRSGGAAGLAQWLDRQRESLAGVEWPHLGISEPVTISGGIVECRGRRLRDAIRAADDCLRSAKTGGRSSILVG